MKSAKQKSSAGTSTSASMKSAKQKSSAETSSSASTRSAQKRSSKGNPTTEAKRRKLTNNSTSKRNLKQDDVLPFDIDSFRTKPEGMTLMVLPRADNRRHTGTFSNAELCLVHTKISHAFVRSYDKFQHDYEKYDYVTNAIITWKSICHFIKYHEEQNVYYEIGTDELYEYIHSRIKKTRKKMNSKQSKGKQIKTFDNFCNIRTIESVYDHSKLYTMDQIKGWTYLSIIHSLFSSFSFYVYAYSHRVLPGVENTVHECTKLKLNFPVHPNMFIIFHGRTVHSGAESKTFSVSSAQTSHDTRLFSYITSKENEAETRRSIRHRNKGKDQSGKVDRDDISVCSETKLSCKACTETMHEDVVEIDLLSEYHSIKPNQRSTSENPFCILGNLDVHGFEVWRGVNTRTKSRFNLKGDIAFLETTEEWKSLDNKTNRKVLKVSRFSEDQGRKKKIQSDAIDDFVSDLEQTVNDHVLPHRSNELGPVALLSNMGTCHEQLRHRDYKT